MKIIFVYIPNYTFSLSLHAFVCVVYIRSLNVTRIVISVQLKCPKQLLSQKDDGRNVGYVKLMGISM